MVPNCSLPASSHVTESSRIFSSPLPNRKLQTVQVSEPFALQQSNGTYKCTLGKHNCPSVCTDVAKHTMLPSFPHSLLVYQAWQLSKVVGKRC